MKDDLELTLIAVLWPVLLFIVLGWALSHMHDEDLIAVAKVVAHQIEHVEQSCTIKNQ